MGESQSRESPGTPSQGPPTGVSGPLLAERPDLWRSRDALTGINRSVSVSPIASSDSSGSMSAAACCSLMPCACQ